MANATNQNPPQTIISINLSGSLKLNPDLVIVSRNTWQRMAVAISADYKDHKLKRVK